MKIVFDKNFAIKMNDENLLLGDFCFVNFEVMG